MSIVYAYTCRYMHIGANIPMSLHAYENMHIAISIRSRVRSRQ
jgi:hypothetical protein